MYLFIYLFLYLFYRNKTFQQAFAARPKIPRTPESGSESGSRPSSSVEIPPLTRSISPPRPPSGKGIILFLSYFNFQSFHVAAKYKKKDYRIEEKNK